MQNLKTECLDILAKEGINPLSSIDFNVNEKLHTLTFEYIIDTFMQASTESQLVFVRALQKAVLAEEMGVKKFFEGMGQLLLMTHLSKEFGA
jgi:hypothetical protein